MSTDSTLTLSQLIALLQNKQAELGDLPVVFWDQSSIAVFNNPQNLFSVNKGKLYFGGFHVNADNYIDLPSHLAPQ